MLSSLSSERSANFGANKVLGTNNLTYNIKYGNYNTRKGDGFYSQASRKERQRKRDMSAILKTIVTIAGIAGVSFLAAKFVPWGKVKNAIDKAKPEVKNFFKSTKEKASKAKDSAKNKFSIFKKKVSDGIENPKVKPQKGLEIEFENGVKIKTAGKKTKLPDFLTLKDPDEMLVWDPKDKTARIFNKKTHEFIGKKLKEGGKSFTKEEINSIPWIISKPKGTVV